MSTGVTWKTLTEAKKTAGGINSADSKVHALCQIAIFQAKAGDLSGARQTLAEEKLFAGDFKDIRLKINALRYIANALLTIDKQDKSADEE